MAWSATGSCCCSTSTTPSTWLRQVLELTEAEMKAIGMVGGAIRKVQRAQRQSRDNRDSLFLPSAKGLSTQEKQCGSTAAEVVVFEPEYYEPATVIHDWRCQLDSSEHDIFVSYRSSSESDSANMLVASLVSGKRKDLSIHPFLDHLCLHDSQDWECGFINALHNSPVIVLLLSERGLERVRQAHTTPDNLLLEVGCVPAPPLTNPLAR
ncbi:uncharacterized protein BJ171DRAFT_163209 [Polychytrium aggregatum]|uniref:uncharacterized protein n=1 Tax=Polychytrium aggregatum TaxID=110093 RepID=UPI0022FDD2BF|nr:uncharacterized protein BJ171DRAFT_163209 [Polychytrium aggregatum]KAI9202883.1 hypothetical protein BJ171DRAFT_163209 [Polychytrium aggregatum]